MIEFVWPRTDGEWWAWSSALVVMLTALWMFFAPRRSLSWMKLQTIPKHPEAVSEVRGPMAGGYFGLALAVMMLHPQPLLYLALGSVLLFTAIGRLISISVDKGNTKHNWFMLFCEATLAFFPIAYAIGIIA